MAQPVDVNQETRNLDKFERDRGVEARLLARFRSRIEREVASLAPATLLDAGCGEGVVTSWLGDVLPDTSITGVDARAAALD